MRQESEQETRTADPTRVEVSVQPSSGEVVSGGGRALATRPVPGLQPDTTARRRLTLFGPFGLLLSLVVMVIVPTAVAGYYFAFLASDIFVSEARFAVRGSTEKLPSSSANVSVMSNLTTMNSNQDAYIVANYIQSLPLLQKLDQDGKLRRVYGAPGVDMVARLRGDATAEQLRLYWSRMVTTTVDTLSGVVSLEVSAFRPQDALDLSRAILAASEDLVNEMSRRKRDDAVRFSNEEVARAEGRLKNARLLMQDFRNASGEIDPVKGAEATSKLLATLKGEQLELMNELMVARRVLAEDSPSVQVLSSRLAAVSAQMNTLAAELTNGDAAGGKTATRTLSQYEGLMVEREFAEKFYTTMLTLAETARLEASRQQLYLITFVEPALADMATYPRRAGNVLVVFVCSLALWGVMSLLTAAVRDHNI